MAQALELKVCVARALMMATRVNELVGLPVESGGPISSRSAENPAHASARTQFTNEGRIRD